MGTPMKGDNNFSKINESEKSTITSSHSPRLSTEQIISYQSNQNMPITDQRVQNVTELQNMAARAGVYGVRESQSGKSLKSETQASPAESNLPEKKYLETPNPNQWKAFHSSEELKDYVAQLSLRTTPTSPKSESLTQINNSTSSSKEVNQESWDLAIQEVTSIFNTPRNEEDPDRIVVSPGGTEHTIKSTQGSQKKFLDEYMKDRDKNQKLTKDHLSKLLSGNQYTIRKGWKLAEKDKNYNEGVKEDRIVISPGGTKHTIKSTQGSQKKFLDEHMENRDENQKLAKDDLSRLLSGNKQKAKGWKLAEKDKNYNEGVNN